MAQSVLELELRAGIHKLDEYRVFGVSAGLPMSLRSKSAAVIFRHVATPNFEMHRFAMVADAIPQLDPVIFEYQQDTFNDLNEYKYHLGKLRLHKGFNSRGQTIVQYKSLIDFTQSNTKPLSTLYTYSGESLVDFHHRLLVSRYPSFASSLSDLSGWLRGISPTAKGYYKSFLRLFIKNAILFENFSLNGPEKIFTESVILPAIREIEIECGYKPLIVALEPTDIEGDDFWLSVPYETVAIADIV